MSIIILPYPNTVATLPGVQGVDWTYLYAPSLKIGGDVSGWRSTIVFNTTMANVGNFVSAIAGTPTVVPTTFGNMLRILPLQNPLFNNLYATSLEAEAYGTPSNSSTALSTLWSDVRVTVTFENPKYDTSGDRAYMSLEVDQGSIYSTVPGRKFKFPDGEPIDQDAGGFATRNSYALTVYQATSLNNQIIDSLVAAPVNSQVFLDWPAGHVLFGGCKSSFSASMGGVIQYQKTYSFTYQSTPWNQAWKRDATLDTPLDPAGNPQYDTSDLNQLLTN